MKFQKFFCLDFSIFRKKCGEGERKKVKLVTASSSLSIAFCRQNLASTWKRNRKKKLGRFFSEPPLSHSIQHLQVFSLFLCIEIPMAMVVVWCKHSPNTLLLAWWWCFDWIMVCAHRAQLIHSVGICHSQWTVRLFRRNRKEKNLIIWKLEIMIIEMFVCP